MVSDKSSLLDRIKYYMENPEEDEVLKAIFSKEERDILHTMSEFEQLKRTAPQGNPKDTNEEVELFLSTIDRERDINLRLKEQLMRQMDILLEKGQAEAWLEIMTWHQVLKMKELTNLFWECNVLEVMLKIFKEEMQDAGSTVIPVLGLRSMKELTEIYFRMVFLIRRMAYGVEITDEMVKFIDESKMFPAFTKVFAEDAGIEIPDRENLLNDLIGREISGE